MPAGATELLAAEVADLDALGFDLSLAGFGESEVGKLIDLFQQGSAPSFPDEAPDPPENPVSQQAISGLWASTGCSVAMP
jgi:hypothetical protein